LRLIWCKDLEDIVNIARGQGWMFHFESGNRHYYYVYAGSEHELLCLSVSTKEPVNAKYVSIDDDGKLKLSQAPILPTCARIINVDKDEGFEEMLRKSSGQR